jgi:hypothetical protein
MTNYKPLHLSRLKYLFSEDKDWKVLEQADSEGKSSKNEYYFKGKRCKRKIIDSQLSQKLAGYRLIEKDIRNIKDWLKNILIIYEKNYGKDTPTDEVILNYDRETFGLVKALFVASMSFYGKLFTTARGRRVKLERSIYDNETDRKMHDDIMEFRHNYTAHSGEEKIENVNVVLAIPVHNKYRKNAQLVCELIQPDSVSPNSIKEMLETINRLHDIVLEKTDEYFELTKKETYKTLLT